MNISDLIKNRRATPPRFLAPKEIPDEVIAVMLENANWAPNHKKTEPWRFKVYKGAAKSKLVEETHGALKVALNNGYPVSPDKIEKFRTNLDRVPVAIVTILQRDLANRLPEWEEIAAVSMGVQNMWLTATEMGLGAFWATPVFMDLFQEVLELEAGQKALGFFYVGEIAMEYPSPGRGNIETKVEWK